MDKKFLIGSRYFFNCYSDFTPSDTDTLIIEEKPKEYSKCLQIRGKNTCIFKWRKMSPNTFVSLSIVSTLPMEVGKFLIKEFNEYIGFKIEHLKKLKRVFDKLDDKHKYEKVIFDAYIENNDFYLTDEQRLKAYEEYKKYREN